MPVTLTRTAEYTVQPFADVAADSAAMNLILDALQADPRAHGPVVGYDPARGRVDAIFQVIPGAHLPTLERATILAERVFNDALEKAGLEKRTAGVTVVEGSDPDLLP